MTAVSPDIPALPANFQSQLHLHNHNRNLPDKFNYGRPQFLQLLTFDELKASADHNVRPIIVPRDISIMPWFTGYAECVNSGKSEWNEDQAAFRREILSHPLKKYPDLPYIYFGIFDGHAGYGAALAASNQFHHILHEKLVDVIDNLLQNQTEAERLAKLNPVEKIHHPLMFHKQISKDELIIGALESAFAEIDTVLSEDRNKYRNAGGCTACVALFILGKIFFANAGDSRGIVCHRVAKDNPKQRHSLISLTLSTATSLCNNSNRTLYNTGNGSNDLNSDGEMVVFPIPFSYDHTPDTERSRLMTVANLNRSYMGNDYIAMEYAKKPMVKDLGTRILYRCGTMKGWTYKTLTRDDLKMPIVTGEGKRSRLLGTIGVTRGFGDHDLRALGSGLPIKPFLSSHPEVNYRDLSKIISNPDDDNEDGDYGVLVMATDGLWDVADNETVSRTVFATLDKYPKERHKYTMVAQELVAKSRGRVNESGHWRLSDSKAAATVDDISVIVIPINQYYKEYVEWQKMCRAHATTNDGVGSGVGGILVNGNEPKKLKEDVESVVPVVGSGDGGGNSDVNETSVIMTNDTVCSEEGKNEGEQVVRSDDKKDSKVSESIDERRGVDNDADVDEKIIHENKLNSS